jgi:hypothetical protein
VGDGLPSSPPDVLRLDAAGADDLLEALEARVPRRDSCVALPALPGGRAFAIGDTHGDWLSTVEAVRACGAAGPASVLVGLGDYIDRSPVDLPCGAVANALYLLSLAARDPERVFLLQGNHETMRRIAAVPHTLPDEVERLWGRSGDRYGRLMGLLERGPLAATSASGAYFAHAGFPRGELPPRWQDAVDGREEDRLIDLVWSEPDASRVRRGVAPAWTERELEGFLGATGLSTFWRGHDPDLAGRPLYDGRAMTLHTTRLYRRYGGVLMAVLPLDHPLARVEAAELRHLSTEAGGRPDRTTPSGPGAGQPPNTSRSA